MNIIHRAISLIQENEPKDGYYTAFSGGKDSIVIEYLARLAGVKQDPHYNNVTIDPPELVRFIKEHYPHVTWNQPKHGNMFVRIENRPSLPPTRSMRWCCYEYKEGGGDGRVKIIGVRAEESAARKRLWKEISEDGNGNKVLCPIVHWSAAEVWAFIKSHNLPYCKLYDEGWTRLGCVGCPLAKTENQQKEFKRWPKYAEKWEKAVKGNWEKYHARKRRDGQPYYHARFKTANDFWQWWLTAKQPDYFRGDCQSMLLMTNENVSDHYTPDPPVGGRVPVIIL